MSLSLPILSILFPLGTLHICTLRQSYENNVRSRFNQVFSQGWTDSVSKFCKTKRLPLTVETRAMRRQGQNGVALEGLEIRSIEPRENFDMCFPSGNILSNLRIRLQNRRAN